MEKTGKIGWGQLAVLLLLGRIFTLMTYAPLTAEGWEYIPLATAISTAIQMVLVIPLVLLSSRPDRVFLLKNSPLTKTVAALYLVFFAAIGADSYAHFGGFLAEVFFPQDNKLALAAILFAVCIYSAVRGLAGIARAGMLVFVLFIAMLLLIFTVSAGEIKWQTLSLPQTKTLAGAVFEDLGNSSELVMAAFLMGRCEKPKRGVFTFLAGKLVILEVISILIITVLGKYAMLTQFPFFSLGSYAGLGGVQRLDAVYLVVWTLIAIIRISLTIFICGELLGKIFTGMKQKPKLAPVLVGAAIFLAGLPLLYGGEISERIFPMGIVTLVFIIPMLFLAVKRRDRA